MKGKKIILGLAAPILAAVLVLGFNGGVARTIAHPVTTLIATWTFVPYETPYIIESGLIIYGTLGDTMVATVIEIPDPVSDSKVVPDTKPEQPKTAFNDYNTFVDSFAKQLTLDFDEKLTAEEKEQKKAEEKIKLLADPDVAEVVKNAPANTQVVNAGEWISAKRNFYEAVEKSGQNVAIVYYSGNHRYSVTIPAGAKVTDLVNEEGYCGFLNLAAHYGATLLK